MGRVSEQPSRYNRSFNGMTGALIVTVLLVLAFVTWRGLFRGDADDTPVAVDWQESVELADTIAQIRDDYGCAVLLVEHDMRVIFRVCETIQVLDFGKTMAAGSPDEIRTNQKVIAAYLGAEAAAEVGGQRAED